MKITLANILWHVGWLFVMGLCIIAFIGLSKSTGDLNFEPALTGLATAYVYISSLFGSVQKQEEPKDLESVMLLAEQGSADAQYNVGVMYENGDGAEKSDEEAVKWFRKAAEQDYEPAKDALQDISQQQPPILP